MVRLLLDELERICKEVIVADIYLKGVNKEGKAIVKMAAVTAETRTGNLTIRPKIQNSYRLRQRGLWS